MTRYGQYKDSGVQWLGEIPAHWKVSKIKRLCNSIYAGGTPSSSQLKYWNGDIPWIPSGCCHDCNVDSAPAYITQLGYNSSSTKLIPANTAIMAMTGATCSQVGYLTFEACANQSVVAYNVNRRKILSRFVFYLLQSMRSYILTFQTGGAQGGINVNDCKNLIIPHIPLVEQDAIVAYLDSEVSKIDEAIKQQQKMIELLNERRQIIISEAVTKGLNPDVKMKDSGIDWMGAIPAHWEIISLKRACTIKTGKTPSSNSTKYWDGGKVNWFTPGDFKDFKLTDSERKVTRTAIREKACFEYPACSVYLIGIGGTIGKIAYSEHSASCNQQINVLIPKRNVHYKYIAYVMTICRPEVMRNANMSTLPIINQEKTGGIMITLPPFLEQKAISQQIEVKCASIQEKINQANTEIALLTERKRIIINDVVTGKIKVL